MAAAAGARMKAPPKLKQTKGTRKDQFNELMRKGALNSGLTPLEFLMLVYRSPKQPLSVRIQAATSCLNYVHRKMPTDITTTNNDPEMLAESVREHIRAAGVTVEERNDGLD